MIWIKRVVLVVVAIVAGAGLAHKAYAIYNNPPPTQSGFPQMLAGDAVKYSSPTLGDLDGDGKLEIIVGGRAIDANGAPSCGGWVYAYRSTGSLYWQTSVRAPVEASPTVADITGDGKPEVIVGLGGVVPTPGDPQCWNGGVIALHGQDGSGWTKGSTLWTFNTQDWLNHAPDGWLDGVRGSPAVGDVDNNGDMEVVFGSWDQCIYLLNHLGQSVWGQLGTLPEQKHCGEHGFYNEDTVWSSPALADLDGDKKLEIVIGVDITAGNSHGDPTGGYLRILNYNGVELAREWLDQRVYSSPAIGDLDNDGALEIVVGTGTNLPGKGYYVTAYDYDPAQSTVKDRLIQKWRSSTTGRVFSSPALGDLNEDGYLDVVVGAFVGDWGPEGAVYAWNGHTGQQLFRTPACDQWGNSFTVESSPTLADIDGDNYLEVLFSHSWEVTILNHNGTYYTDYSNPSLPGTPNNPACARGTAPSTTLTYSARNMVYASPAVGDLDNDGDIEVVIAGAFNDTLPYRGGLYAWTGHSNGKRPWPMFHQNARHTGVYDPPRLAVQPGSLLALHQVGQTNPEKVTLIVKNEGQESFSWTSSKPSPVTLSPASGTVITEVVVQVTINTAGYTTAGTYSLGNVVITASGIDGSPKTLPVTLRVAALRKNFLPLILKGH